MNPHERATQFLLYLPPLGSVLLLRIFTWATAFSYRWIPYLRRRRVIREALGSSLNAKDRLSGWSSHDTRSRPISMRFHDVWQDPDCPVMKWYNNLSPISTSFRSIQHRRNIDKPFYHEFLQIKLKGGHICIVERMGEGVDTDAIRWTGCTSHDIIQCFSPDQYNAWLDEPKRVRSEIIDEVTFPRDFDLMDVLAICYTIKQHARAKSYTLQRFNCYFLCCTILSILARRTVSWERTITQRVWETILNETRDDLRNYDPSNFLNKRRRGSEKSSKSTPSPQMHGKRQKSRNKWLLSFLRDDEEDLMPLEAIPEPASPADSEAYAHDVRKYLAVGICSLLEPKIPEPEGFLLVSLMSRLNEGARFSLREELSRCLWQERLEATVVEAIKYYVWRSANSIIEGATRGSKRMSLLLGNVNEAEFPRNQLDFSSIQSDVQKGFLRAFLKICQHHINIAQARYNIESFEGQYPLWKRFGATIVGLVATALAYPAIVLFPYITFGSKTFGTLRDDLVILDMCDTYQVNPRAMVWAFTPAIEIRQIKYAVLGMFRENVNRESDLRREEDAFRWNMHLAYGWAEELGLILEKFIRPGQRNIPGALAFLNSVFPGFIWENCLLGCVSEKMGECVRREIEGDEERVEVHNGSGDAEPGPYKCTVQEFQERLLGRIKAHARRVDHFQLAEALVVETGMANAMSEIWASLPSDFGSM